MLVTINGTPLPNSAYDTPFKQWVEDGAQSLFGLPQGAWHLGDIKSADSGGIGDQVADKVATMFGDWAHHAAILLLHMAPQILLVVCMASLLGIMIGSERCKHYASVSALGALITGVLSHVY